MVTQLSTMLPQDQLMPRWASQLNPFLQNPMNSVNILSNIVLINGVTVINHKLQRQMQGWFFVDIQGPATIYRSQPFNNLTLTLTSNAAVTVNIGVF